MKPFLEVITEQSPNDKLDKLTHNIPLSTKRLKQLNKFSDLALMLILRVGKTIHPQVIHLK